MECDTCNGTGEVCKTCDLPAADCECDNFNSSDCLECAGTGEIDDDEEDE